MATKKFALLPTDDADRVTIGIKRAARLPGAARAQRHRVNTPWGVATLLVVGESLIALDPPDRVFAQGAKKGARRVPALQIEGGGADDLSKLPANLRAFAERLVAYLEGNKVKLACAEEIAGWLDAADVGGFRKLSSLKLVDVPCGTTITYGGLAELAGRPRASRAVGTACAKNPLPLVVPCHRVLPASGELGSYGFHGPTYKRALLELEGWKGNPVAPATLPRKHR